MKLIRQSIACRWPCWGMPLRANYANSNSARAGALVVGHPGHTFVKTSCCAAGLLIELASPFPDQGDIIDAVSNIRTFLRENNVGN